MAIGEERGGSEREGRKGARVSRVQRATQQLHFHLDRRKRVAAMMNCHQFMCNPRCTCAHRGLIKAAASLFQRPI